MSKASLYVISGASGMTGNELSRQLISRGDSVIGFDNFFCSSIKTLDDVIGNGAFSFHEWDINVPLEMDAIDDEVQKKMSGGTFERLIYINCAAVVHTEHFYHVNSTFTTNVLGMKDFLDRAVKNKADAFINCSTSEVYSMASEREGGVKESDFLMMADAEHSQRTSYAVGKLMTEFFMKDAVDEGKIRGCSIRFANVYSKNELMPKHIIPHIMHSLLENDGKVELLENSKKNRRTFLHNIDSCRAVLALCDHPDALDGTIYNVATQEEVTIIRLVDICAEALGIKDHEIVYKGYRESDPERRILNTEKITERTGWKPTVSLHDGIAMVASELKEQG